MSAEIDGIKDLRAGIGWIHGEFLFRYAPLNPMHSRLGLVWLGLAFARNYFNVPSVLTDK